MNFPLTILKFSTRSIASINNDIDDELEFHIQCRTDDLVADGLTLKEATEQANAAFGSTDAIRKECQRINYGGQKLLAFALLAGLVLSVLAIGWLSWQLALLKDQHADMARRLDAASAAAAVPVTPAVVQDELLDLTGTVSGPNGPVQDATVTLIFKSWPNGQFNQKKLATSTDENGKFVFKELYSKDMQTAYLVSIVKEGFTLESKYWVNDKRRKIKPVKMRVKKAVAKTLTIYDKEGNAVPDTDVFVLSRNTNADGTKGDFIYNQSRDDVMQQTDEDGKVTMAYFEAGDEAKIGAIIDGQMVELKFKVDDQLEQSVGGPDKGEDSGKTDVTGAITDKDGNAIPDATVLLVHKHWPGGRYKQNFFTTKTDAKGNFIFPDRYDEDAQYALLVSVIADGSAMQSRYVFKRDGGKQRPFKLKLEKAIDKTFAFQSADGSPLKEVNVFPVNRNTAGGKEHFIFPKMGHNVDVETDRDGKAQFNLFAEGDTAIFGFADGRKAEVKVTGDAEQIVTVKKN